MNIGFYKIMTKLARDLILTINLECDQLFQINGKIHRTSIDESLG